MKKEISPALTITIVALVVLVIGIFAYQRIFTNPPVPTDHVDSFIRGTNKGAGPPETAPPAGEPTPRR